MISIFNLPELKQVYYRPYLKDGGRYCFQFVSSHLDGWGLYPILLLMGGGRYPIPGQDGGYSHPRSGKGVSPSQIRVGGTPSQVRMGYTSIPGLDEGVPPYHVRVGYPHLRSGQGGYPSLVSMRVVPCWQDGVPPISRMAIPPCWQDGVPPSAGWGYPPSAEWRIPPLAGWVDGGTPLLTGWQYLAIQVRTGGTPNRNTIRLYLLHGGRYASCVHAGGLSCYQ